MNFMTRRKFTKMAMASGLIGLGSTTANAATIPKLNLDEPIEDLKRRILFKVITLQAVHGVPGLSLTLLREGTPVWSEAYGVKDLEARSKMDVDTVFETSALTKPIHAYAALALWNEGRLDLDRKFGLYLSEEFQKNIPESYLDFTARMVLCHRTGLPNMHPGPDRPLPAFTPGESFLYSGIGYTILQEVMTEITGKQIDELCNEYVLHPLGMDHSSLVWIDEFDDTLATAYGIKLKLGLKRKLTKPMGRSSLVCSPSDFAKFVSHTLQCAKTPPDEKNKAIYDLMLTPVSDVQKGVKWGMGWGLQECGGETSFWHWGNNENKYHSLAIGYPKHGLGIVLMANSGNGLRLCRELVPEIIGGCHPIFDYKMVVP